MFYVLDLRRSLSSNSHPHIWNVLPPHMSWITHRERVKTSHSNERRSFLRQIYPGACFLLDGTGQLRFSITQEQGPAIGTTSTCIRYRQPMNDSNARTSGEVWGACFGVWTYCVPHSPLSSEGACPACIVVLTLVWASGGVGVLPAPPVGAI